VRVAELGPGEPLGEMGQQANDARFNTVTAQTDLATLEITAKDVREVFEREPAVLEAFMTLVQNRQRAAFSRTWV